MSKIDDYVPVVLFSAILLFVNWVAWKLSPPVDRGLTVPEEFWDIEARRIPCPPIQQIPFTDNRDYRAKPATREEIARYIESNNGAAPPVNWFPNGDPFRNLTAAEANAIFSDQD